MGAGLGNAMPFLLGAAGSGAQGFMQGQHQQDEHQRLMQMLEMEMQRSQREQQLQGPTLEHMGAETNALNERTAFEHQQHQPNPQLAALFSQATGLNYPGTLPSAQLMGAAKSITDIGRQKALQEESEARALSLDPQVQTAHRAMGIKAQILEQANKALERWSTPTPGIGGVIADYIDKGTPDGLTPLGRLVKKTDVEHQKQAEQEYNDSYNTSFNVLRTKGSRLDPSRIMDPLQAVQPVPPPEGALYAPPADGEGFEDLKLNNP